MEYTVDHTDSGQLSSMLPITGVSRRVLTTPPRSTLNDALSLADIETSSAIFRDYLHHVGSNNITGHETGLADVITSKLNDTVSASIRERWCGPMSAPNTFIRVVSKLGTWPDPESQSVAFDVKYELSAMNPGTADSDQLPVLESDLHTFIAYRTGNQWSCAKY